MSGLVANQHVATLMPGCSTGIGAVPPCAYSGTRTGCDPSRTASSGNLVRGAHHGILARNNLVSTASNTAWIVDDVSLSGSEALPYAPMFRT